jgi:hypothetical protein
MNVIVIASGQSLTREQCEATRGAGYTIAVGDAYRLTTWCDAIVSTDRAWWRKRPDAMAMACRKFCMHSFEGTEHAAACDSLAYGSSSGVLGLWVARMLGASRILMLGFDNHGTHFFGPHVDLKNTSPQRFKEFADQFYLMRGHLKLGGVRVLNCTPGTALDMFPKASLSEGLKWLQPLKSAA